jgi:Right handed beta helix region/IPT/TIG domain
MMRLTLRIVLLVASAASRPAVALPVVTVHAAPEGQGGACSMGNPCALRVAQHRAQEASGRANADVHVVLADGIYELGGPLVFTGADSGRSGHRVVYRAAPGAHPVLSGGLRITGWQPPAGGSRAWSASVPAGFRTRQLYVNGVRAARTSSILPDLFVQIPEGYLEPLAIVSTWRNPSDIELVFQYANGPWTEPRCTIASVDGPIIRVAQPCWDNLHIPDNASLQAKIDDPKDNAMGGFNGISPVTNPSSIENVFELLSQPGEWYLDRPARTIYYIPRAGEDLSTADVVAGRLESLVEGRGTLDDPIENLELRGLQFSYATWLRPSDGDGFAEMQANVSLVGRGADGRAASYWQGTCQYSDPPGSCPFAAWTKAPAAVSFRATRNLVIEGNSFRHLGAAALDLSFGSQNNLIRGNDFRDVSGSGIQLGDTNDRFPATVGADDREINAGDRIVDNHVHAIGAEYHGAVGIWVGYTQHTLVAHNQIDDLPYSGISFGWGGWHTDSLHPDADRSLAADNEISHNLIFRVMQVLGDGGAIYTNGVQGPGVGGDFAISNHGLMIRDNVAYQALLSEFIYYNDEASGDVTLARNVEYRATLLAHGGCSTAGPIRLVDNYWAQLFSGYICPPPPLGVSVGSHHLITDHPAPGDIPHDILSDAGLTEPYRSLTTDERPLLTGLGPIIGLSTGGTSMLISGSGFTPDTGVSFGDVPASDVRVLSSGYLIATSPPGFGLVNVTVTTPAGTSATSLDSLFLYL